MKADRTLKLSNLPRSTDTKLKRGDTMCYDNIFKMVWVGDRASGIIRGFSPHNSAVEKCKTHPVSGELVNLYDDVTNDDMFP